MDFEVGPAPGTIFSTARAEWLFSDMERPQEGSNLKVHIHLFGIFRWHSWGEYLYLTLCTPTLHTYPRASWLPDEGWTARTHPPTLYSELSTPN